MTMTMTMTITRLLFILAALLGFTPAYAQLYNQSPTIVGAINYCEPATASGTAYGCSLVPALPSYLTGACYTFKADVANTGAATLNLNSLGTKAIKKAVGGVTTDLVANDIRAGQLVTVCYDGTNMQMQSLLGLQAGGVTGPGSSTSGNVASFNGTDGSVIQDSGIAAANVVQAASNITTGLPVIGNSNNRTVATGTRTGNTTEYATWSGTKTAGKTVTVDASGNMIVSAQDVFVPNTHLNTESVEVTIGSAAAATACTLVQYAGTINDWTVAATTSGNATIDITAVAEGSWNGPGSASSIVGAGTKPNLSAAIRNTSSTLTNWTTSITAKTWFCFVPSSVTAGYPIFVSLKVTRN